jgi:hypothetical protein
MNFFALEDHTSNCSCVKPRPKELDEWMPISPRVYKKFFVFQYKYDFYCIIYCYCWEGYSHLDFKMDMLNHVSLKKKYPKSWNKYDYNRDISKSNPIRDVLKDRDIAHLFNAPMDEICYTYSSMTETYGMISKQTGKEFLINSINYQDNYWKALKEIKTKDILDNIDREFITDQIQDLYSLNKDHYSNLTDVQKVSLTKLLSSTFLKQSI